MVGLVHRDDVGEAFDVGVGVELAGALVGDVDAVEGGGLDGARVRWVSYVPCSGAAGVDVELVGEVVLVDEVLEDAVGEGGAADVSETDEEDGVLVGHERVYACAGCGEFVEDFMRWTMASISSRSCPAEPWALENPAFPE